MLVGKDSALAADDIFIETGGSMSWRFLMKSGSRGKKLRKKA
jgi:hypothetical protein